MEFDEYRAAPGTNITTLLEIGKSPEHYRHAKDVGRADTDAFRMGRLYHLAILEPEIYARDVVTWTGGKRGTNVYKAFAAENKGKQIVTEQEHRDIMTVSTKLLSHPLAADLLSKGDREQTIMWTEPNTGRACKSRLDICYQNPNGPNRIVDLKGTRSCTHKDFSKSAANLRYMTQAAFYRAAFESKYQQSVCQYILIAFEKVAPFSFGIYEIVEGDLDNGVDEYLRLLRLLGDCEETDHWPGPTGDKIEELMIPNWAYSESDNLIIDGEVTKL